MLPREVFIDQLAICASAPLRDHRSAALKLLARERIAMFDIGNRDYRGRFPDFAYEHLDAGRAGSPRDAWMYLHYTSEDGQSHFAGSVPQVPGPRADYEAALGTIVVEAAALRTAVIEGMGEPAFTAARAPYVAVLERLDFEKRHDVAHYWVQGEVEPGAVYPLRTTHWTVPGYSEIKDSDPSEVTVQTAGTYHAEFEVDNARSSSTANPTEMRVVLVVNGSEVAAFVATRNSADSAQSIPFARQRVDVPISAPLTVRNGSSSRQWIAGHLRLWKDA